MSSPQQTKTKPSTCDWCEAPDSISLCSSSGIVRSCWDHSTKLNSAKPKTKTPLPPKEEECPGCLRPKHDETYETVKCVRCETEMCNECFSVSPVEGDDDVYCKRCAQERLDEAEAEEEDGWEEECNQCNEVLDESTGREWIEQLGCLCARCYDLRKDDFPPE